MLAPKSSLPPLRPKIFIPSQAAVPPSPQQKDQEGGAVDGMNIATFEGKHLRTLYIYMKVNSK